MAKAQRFKHTAAQSKVAKAMRGGTPVRGRSARANTPTVLPRKAKPTRTAVRRRPRTVIKKVKPKSVPVKVVTKHVHHYPAKKAASGGHFAKGFHAGKAVGSAIADLITEDHHR